MHQNKEKSFTLIEVMISVAIIVILGSIIAVNVGRQARMAARDAKRIADLALVQSYLEIYYNKNGHYPAQVVADRLIEASQDCPWSGSNYKNQQTCVWFQLGEVLSMVG